MIQARFIARPLQASLAAQPFCGVVMSRFARAATLIETGSDPGGQLIALTLPSLGNGPFSIVLDAPPDWFAQLVLQQPAQVDAEWLTLGSWRIPLQQAECWEPTLPVVPLAFYQTPWLPPLLQPYAAWPPRVVTTNAILHHMAQHLAQGAQALQQALISGRELAPAVSQLAGLGSGLTPAGDDYLLGVMVALWLLRRRTGLATMAQVAAPRTTQLSAAFLSAAAQGQLMESWHSLSTALAQGNRAACAAALTTLAAFGASSGRDALAGFAQTVLKAV